MLFASSVRCAVTDLLRLHYFGFRAQGISRCKAYALRSMFVFNKPRPQASSSLPHNRVALLAHLLRSSLAVLRGCHVYYIRPQFYSIGKSRIS